MPPKNFCIQYPHWKKVQYDMLSITRLKDEPVEYFLIEDVYDGSLDSLNDESNKRDKGLRVEYTFNRVYRL